MPSLRGRLQKEAMDASKKLIYGGSNHMLPQDSDRTYPDNPSQINHSSAQAAAKPQSSQLQQETARHLSTIQFNSIPVTPKSSTDSLQLAETSNHSTTPNNG